MSCSPGSFYLSLIFIIPQQQITDAASVTIEADDLRAAGFILDNIWGHRVANQAVDFLEKAGDDPFLLICSFDEPHGPFVAPPEYWEKFTGEEIPMRPNCNAPADGKPRILQVHREQRCEMDWQTFASSPMMRKWYGCNSYIDREIGRVVEAVDRLHADDTLVIYTTDHGDQARSHGLLSKGPMMYEESCNIPFIARIPDGPSGAISWSLISHVDILPTLPDFAGVERPEVLNGTSLKLVFKKPEDPDTAAREFALMSFHRFAINHDSMGEFYPIRNMPRGFPFQSTSIDAGR